MRDHIVQAVQFLLGAGANQHYASSGGTEQDYGVAGGNTEYGARCQVRHTFSAVWRHQYGDRAHG
jgi:hypothetical protein